MKKIDRRSQPRSVDCGRQGLIDHLSVRALGAKRRLARTRKDLKAARDGDYGLMPWQYYERMLPLHQATRDKWVGWLKSVKE